MPTDVEHAQVNDEFKIGYLRAADVVFEYPKSDLLWRKVIRSLNVAGQRILAAIRTDGRISLREKSRPYSHVMLGLGSDLVIHADGKSVAVEIVPDALRLATNTASEFKVYRHRGLSDEVRENIAAAATRYYSQRYSFLSYFGSFDSKLQGKAREKEDTKQFCSRLVAHSYRVVGEPITQLPDNKVLPLDLYRICQSDPESWEDISAGFIQGPVPPSIDEAMGTINIPGEGEATLSEFMTRSDELLLESANLSKLYHAMRYKSILGMLSTEATLSEFCATRFDYAKGIHIAPDKIDDESAIRVVRVLQQLEILLSLSYLPTVELLVEKMTIFGDDKGRNVSPYVGLPPPVAIREMQKSREMVNIYTYLLFAEVGICVILAHHLPHEKFERWRSARRDYAEKFFEALPEIKDLNVYKDEEKQFLWVGNESDRKTSRSIVRNIVAALEVVEILRKSLGRRAP